MLYTKSFCNKLETWCNSIGLPNITVTLTDTFSYNYGNGNITFGMYEDEGISKQFEQFLYENGSNYYNLLYPVMSFLHEVGHSFTLNAFSEQELFIYSIIADSCDTNFEYWLVPTEFSANIWTINFINNNIDKVEELTNIMYENINEVSAEYFNENSTI